MRMPTLSRMRAVCAEALTALVDRARTRLGEAILARRRGGAENCARARPNSA